MPTDRPPSGRSLLAASAALLLLGATSAQAQSEAGPAFRFGIVRDASLAWYQVNPHTSLLWATTCPEDPYWRPGESRNTGWDTRGLPPPKYGSALVYDSVIPLYRRRGARAVCVDAVRGGVTAADTVTWRELRGTITIDPTQLVSGLPLRDKAAQSQVFGSDRWPTIRFEIDSLGDTTPGDTLQGNIYGRFFFRDVEAPSVAAFSAWREPLGLRVTARLDMIPQDLVDVYGVSIHNIRLGLTSGVWQMIHFGVDAILKPEP
ncbi:MAG: YceI family protein [Gemmatimonadetes bacterium]|nr:YceI family protein [Gemmatimonadota bacterium]